MYKGRFDKSGGRSTADILRERAAESPDQAAPINPAPGFPPRPPMAPSAAPVSPRPAPDPDRVTPLNLNFGEQDPAPDFNPDFWAPQAPAAAPQSPGPEFSFPPQAPVMPQQNHPPQRPPMPQQNVPPQRPVMPQQNIPPQRPPMPQQNVPPQRPVMPQQNVPPQRPVMPQQNIPPQRPPMPHNGTAPGPGGMPVRPGFQPQANGPRPGQPGTMPQRPGVQTGPGGMPIRPGFHPLPNGPRPGQPGTMSQQPGVQTGPGGMPIRPGYRPGAKGPAQPSRPAAEKPAGKAPVRKSSVVFYASYFGFIFLFFVLTFCGLSWLKGWLTDYEAAQPYLMADQIFKQNFENPNWKIIYQNSTLYATNPDDCDAYVAMMEEKVGSNQLTYQETSAGLSGDKKYFIKMGDERIASFTLEGDAKYITDIPDWKLGDIELMVDYDNSYRIQMLEGHKAFVNDRPLDDSYTIMKASTMAQEFLPVGTKGIRMWTQQVDNLIGKPNVRIQDEKGQEMEVIYDAETQTFLEKTKANTITDEQKDAAIGAAKVYGRYMIAQAGRGELAKYFDASSKIYSTIRDSEKIVQQSFFSSYDFGNAEILDFCMYSDDLFSARVSVVLNVTRKDGTIKPFPIETTLFFSQHPTGKWLAYDMTNEDVQKPIGQVRLTFNSTDGTLIASDFYDTNATELDTPMITVPEGKVFSGWVRETVSSEGKKVLEVVFTPDETGHVTLSGNTGLEPMVLTPLFENPPAEGGTN